MFAVAIVIRLHALNGRYGAFYVMHTGNCNSKVMHNFFCKYSWVTHGFSRQRCYTGQKQTMTLDAYIVITGIRNSKKKDRNLLPSQNLLAESNSHDDAC